MAPSIMERYVHAMARVEAFLAKSVASLSAACVMSPRITIVTYTCFCAALTLGLLTAKTENGTRALWTDQDSEAIADLNYAETVFEKRSRGNELLITGPNGADNVITLASLRAVMQLHERLMELTFSGNRTYVDICEPDDFTPSGCNVRGVPRFWNLSLTEFDAMETSDASVADTCAQDDYPGGFSVIRDLDFGLWTLETPQELRARAVSVRYPTLPGDADASREWEALFIDAALETTLPINVRVQAERSLDDELAVNVSGDILLVGGTYVMMILFVSLFLGKPCHALHGRWALASADVLAILLAVGAGYGLAALCGVPFTTIVQVVPFLLVAIGVDNALMVTAAFDRTPLAEPVDARMYEAMFEAGMSISVASGTNFLAFMLAAGTALPAVEYFGLYAACSVAFVYIAHITVFPAMLALDAKRVNAGRRDVLCCLQAPQKMVQSSSSSSSDVNVGGAGASKDAERGTLPNAEDSTDASTRQGPVDDGASDTAADEKRGENIAESSRMRIWFRDVYAPFILRKPVKIAVMLFFCGLTALGVLGALQIENSFSVRLLAPKGSYLLDFYDLQEELYGGSLTNGQPFGLYFKDIDFSQRAVHEEVRRLSDAMLDADTVDAGKGRIDWHEAFSFWASTQPSLLPLLDGGFVTGTTFESALGDWLDDEASAPFRTHVVRDAGGALRDSRIIFFLVNSKGSDDDIAAYEETTQLAKDTFLEPKPFASATSFPFYHQFTIITQLSFSTFGLAIAAVVAIAAFLLVHPLMVVLCALTLTMLFACLLGTVPVFWDIPLSSVSLTTLLMAIGIAVDSLAHVCYAFGTQSPKLSRDDRVRNTLFNIGPAVSLALLTTLLGVLPLALADSEIFVNFLEIFVSIFLCGSLFGLVFLPVLLSIVGPAVWRPQKLEDMRVARRTVVQGASERRRASSTGTSSVEPT